MFLISRSVGVEHIAVPGTSPNARVDLHVSPTIEILSAQIVIIVSVHTNFTPLPNCLDYLAYAILPVAPIFFKRS